MWKKEKQAARQVAEEKTNVTIYGIVAATCTCNNEAATAAAAVAVVIRVCATCVCWQRCPARRHVSTDQLVISFCSAAASAAAAGNPYKPNMLTKHEKQN